MIAIVRPPAPAFLTEANGRWMQEVRDAVAHYTNPARQGEFRLRLYRDERVKNALRAVFIKCAYCDSFYRGTSDGDVEHFRPKGRVKEKQPQTPGYYWLANDWDNLLLSCQHCNQSRRHLLEGDAHRRSRGKLDQFPIGDPACRVTHPGDPLDAEEQVRLLVNPCRDQPAEHFAYEIDKALVLGLTPRGETSIEVYVLQRHELVSARHETLLDILHQMGVVKRELERYNQDPTPLGHTALRDELHFLMRYCRAERPYAGMARYFVKTFLEENNLTNP